MSEPAKPSELEAAEEEIEQAERASAEMRTHLKRAKDLVKNARETLTDSEERTFRARSGRVERR